jgi:glutathione S-transferase
MSAPPMLTLYHAPDNASLVLRLALEEAGLAFETVLVDRAVEAQKAPAYLALNPMGLIPTLLTPEGPISETAACLLWLSETCREAGLGPAPGAPGRGAFLRWLFFLSNTVHADLVRLFHPERYVPAEAIGAHHEMTTRSLSAHLAILDDVAQAEPSLFAPPSALALYLGTLMRWSALYPVSGPRWLRQEDYPALRAMLEALEARPAVQAAARAEGLGERPFTAPRLPQPLEGPT